MTALDIPLHQVTFVAVDVETTGLDPERDVILEIGAVRMQGQRVLDEWDTLVYVDRTVPLQARRVHGIGNEMLIGKPRIAQAMSMLREFTTDGTLVEHSNKAFDVLFLEKAFGRTIDAPYVNTCMLSRKLFPHIPRHSLDECCRRFQILNEERAGSGRHRALADARATALLLQKLLDLCSPRYPRLSDLVGACSIERTATPRRRR